MPKKKPNFSPFLSCVCPFCLEKIYLGDCGIFSKTLKDPVNKPPTRLIHRLFARIFVKSLNDPKHQRDILYRKCIKCGRYLPSNIEHVRNLTFAVVGDKASGKSHYIAALAHQMNREWGGGGGNGSIQIECLTLEKEKEFEKLFEEKQAFFGTQRAVDSQQKPLVYNIVVKSSRHRPRPFNIFIYDVSGEDLEDKEKLVRYLPFVFKASAFIFIADPLSMPKIKSELFPILQSSAQSQTPGQTPIFARPVARALDAIIKIFVDRIGEKDGSCLSGIPVAVMLSKADLVKNLGLAKAPVSMANPTYGSNIDLQDIEIVNKEVKNLLEKYGEGNLCTSTNHLEQVSFFASSATGESPDTQGKFAKVEPCRCLDPFLWILYELGIIGAK